MKRKFSIKFLIFLLVSLGLFETSTRTPATEEQDVFSVGTSDLYYTPPIPEREPAGKAVKKAAEEEPKTPETPDAKDLQPQLQPFRDMRAFFDIEAVAVRDLEDCLGRCKADYEKEYSSCTVVFCRITLKTKYNECIDVCQKRTEDPLSSPFHEGREPAGERLPQ